MLIFAVPISRGVSALSVMVDKRRRNPGYGGTHPGKEVGATMHNCLK
jgi:hypothetical protein